MSVNYNWLAEDREELGFILHKELTEVLRGQSQITGTTIKDNVAGDLDYLTDFGIKESVVQSIGKRGSLLGSQMHKGILSFFPPTRPWG